MREAELDPVRGAEEECGRVNGHVDWLHGIRNSCSWRFSDRIATVTINRPDKLNALNDALMKEIGTAIDELGTNAGVGAIILTGAGRAFVAGADIAKLATAQKGELEKVSRFGQDVFRRIELSSKPVIAAVNGFALGGGCELALACHVRIASTQAKFGLPEVKLGLIPGYGGTQRLPRLIGRGPALQLILTGDTIDGTGGLLASASAVNSVVEPDVLLTAAQCNGGDDAQERADRDDARDRSRGCRTRRDARRRTPPRRRGCSVRSNRRPTCARERRPFSRSGRRDSAARDVTPAPPSRVTLDSIAIRDFRNIARADVALPPDGTRASSATTARGRPTSSKPSRTSNCSAPCAACATVISRGLARPRFHVAAESSGAMVRRVAIGVERTGKKENLPPTGVETPRLTDALSGALPSVCFSPADIALIARARRPDGGADISTSHSR